MTISAAGEGLASARPGRRSVRGLLARTPLRVKLVGALLVLLIAALAGSFALSTATLQNYLIGRVDSQLKSVRGPIAEHQLGSLIESPEDHRPHDHPGDDGAGDSGGSGPGNQLGLPSAYVVQATNSTGGLVYETSSLADSGQSLPQLPRLPAAQVAGRGDHFLTTKAVRGDETWRVLVTPITLANGTPGTLLIAQSLTDVQKTVDHLRVLFLIIGTCAVIVLGGVGYLVVRASLRPLRTVERTAAKIAGGELSHRVPDADPRTEVGQLSKALNTMLAEIETAFAQRAASEEAARGSEDRSRRSEAEARRSEDRMRRFVADASHELRTPLTSIRGFAELYRQGAATDDDEVRRYMGRIEDEAKRMGVLVEDLLLLARLDQERPLASVPVDLLALAGDAVHDAQAADHTHPISLEIGATDPPPVVIGDEARLRQVLGNLVANALTHTPAGTPVTVRIETRQSADRHPATCVVTVADRGPGMTAETAGRVFERFYRADSSRSRREGSTGLGLAIVAALVAGHGGKITVDTAPGAGATFRVELPMAEAADTALVQPQAGTDS